MLGCLAALSMGCGDGGTAHGPAVAGFYELASINGSTMPWTGQYAPVGPPLTITGGVLLLREDGTFGVGIHSREGGVRRGRYTVSPGGSGAEAEVTMHTPRDGWSHPDTVRTIAEFHADSLMWTVSTPASGYLTFHYVFRRSSRPLQATVRGRYGLARVGTRTLPAPLWEDVVGDSRRARVVLHDTLDVWDDGVFLQFRRVERILTVSSAGDSTWSFGPDWHDFGWLAPDGSDRVVLHFFFPWTHTLPETLSVRESGAALERHWAPPTASTPVVEHYRRRP